MSYIPGSSSPRSWLKLNRWDVMALALAGTFLLLFLWRAQIVTRHHWNWEAVLPFLLLKNSAGNWQPGLLLSGLFTTIKLGLWSLLLSLITGWLVGALSARKRGLDALPAAIYINLIRNTPPLVLLFLVYFFAGSFFTQPLLNLEQYIQSLPPWCVDTFSFLFASPGNLDRMFAAILTLGIYQGAYVAEIVRSGIESVPKAQWEASYSQGFSPYQQFRYIIMPQAQRLMLPALAGQCLSTFKATSLASLVSVPELTFQSLEVMAITRMTFELWLVTALLYLLLSMACTSFTNWMERRNRWRPL